MSVKEKLKMFNEELSSMTTLLEKNQSIDQTLISNRIILIKKDLMSEDGTTKRTAQDMLEILLNQKSQQVQTEIIKSFIDDSGNDLFDSLVVKSVKKRFIDNIMKAQNFTDILLPWHNVDTMKVRSILEDVFTNELPREKCKYFLISKVIPTMMLLSTEKTLRNIYIEIAFLLSETICISDLTPEEVVKFIKEINTKYIGGISQLRDSGFLNWHKLWIFLVRFCDKEIHNSMDLTNRLLRVVEFAFRNSSVEQRLKGYDCWKELIDNASLDKNHICSTKQIKLLITPLRAKFSKQEVVICKRFEIFVYLLQKLQQEAVLCLKEFLEFCFGSIHGKTDTRSGQGRAIPQLWIKSTKVLVEVIGHSHGNTIECLNTKDVINLREPIINIKNIQKFYKVIINSVSESCILLKDVDMESKRMEVIKCMWVTIFDIVVPGSCKDEYFQILSEVLDNFIQLSTSEPYFHDLIVLIFTVLMSFDEDMICEYIKSILSQLLTILFTAPNIPLNISENFKQALMHSFSKVIQKEDKVKMMNIILSCYATLKPHEESISNMAKIWIFLATELVSDLTVLKIEEFPKLDEFFLWPASNMHQMDENSKKSTTLNWLKIYKKLNQDSDTTKLQVMKDLENIFKNNPLLSSNVISLLNIMSQFETKFTQDFVNKMMKVTSMILVLPNLKSEDENKLSTLVMQYFEPSLECYKLDSNEVIMNLCTSIEHILRIHGGFRILEPLASFLKQSRKEIRANFSKYLENPLLDLFNKESDSSCYSAKELSKALQVINENEEDGGKKTFVIPTGRSARIANLVKNCPKSPNKQKKAVAPPTALKLFGKDLETMSPLKVKGSQLNNTPSKKKKISNSSRIKSSTTPSINDESSSEFVPIDTQIKLQPDKLSDHQREVMKKRREDIPALYQDLSQSMSQDMFSSKSNSKEEIKAGPKVVVEFVEPLSIPTELDDRNWGYREEDVEIQNIDKPQEAYTQSNNIQNSESDIFSNASNDAMMSNLKSSEILVTTGNKILKEEAVQKPVVSEQRISSDLFSDESQLSRSDNKQEEKSGMNKKKIEEDSEEKKRRKMEAELLKLKMDIVGAAEFVATARRTRHKEKFKKLEEFSKNKTSPKPEKGRKSLSLERNDSKIATKRRKSSGAVLVASDLSIAFSQSEINPSNDGVQPQKSKKSEEEAEDSLERLKSNPQVEIITTSNDDNKEITLSNEKTGKIKQIPPRMANDKESRKPTQLHDEKEATTSEESSAENNLLENRVNVPKVALKTNTKGKSLKSTLGNENPTSVKKRGRPTKKDKSKESPARSTSGNDTSKETDDIQYSDKFIQTIDESSQCTPKRGLKRKYSTDEDDEDIIQSSQESAAEVTPLLNSSKKKLNKISSEQSKSYEENTIVQQKTLTAADFIMSVRNSNEEVIYQEKEITEASIIAKGIEKSNDTETIETQTEDLIKECDGTVETPDLTKEMEEEKTVVEICNGSENISPLHQKIEVALNQVANLEKEIEESRDKNEEIRDRNSVVEATEVDNLNEMIAEELLEANTTQDTTVTHEITQESSVIQDSTQEDFPSEIADKINVETQDTQTQPQPIITQETLTQESNITSSGDVRPHVFYFDLPKKPILTESEQMMCKMDTMSTCLQNDSEAREDNMESSRGQEVVELKTAFNDKEAESIEDILATPSTGSPPLSTPPRSPSIPSSPITFDTPNRTSELLDNTMDISPITSTTNSPVTEVSAEVPKAIAIFFREEDDDDKDIHNNLEEGSSFSDECEDRQNVIEETEKPHSEEDLIFEAPDKTVAPTPAAAPKASDPPQKHPVAAARFCSMGVVSPVPTKLFLKRRGGGVACSPSTGRIKRLMSHLGPKRPVDCVEEEIDDDDILRFTRDIPSPLAVPRSGILKRKLSDLSDGDGLSPCAKRKRVNFSDPCLTSRKIFIKDDYQPSLEAKRLFDPIPKTNQVTLRDLFNYPEDSGTPETITEIECPETEPSLEIVNPMMLRKDRPIYPKLVDCKDDVLVILKRVTSPIFITALTNKLKTKNIRTIGDLAQQTELEINRIPFKVPVVANVYKALDSYYRMKNGITGTEVETVPKCNGNEEVEKKAKTVEVTKVNVATEMKSLVEKATKENNTLEDLARILLSSMGKRKIIDTLKKLDSPVTVEDFLEGTSHDQVLKHVLDKKDPAEVLETVQRNLNQVQRENLPWESLLKDRPVSDLKRGITALTEQNFSRAEIIENCLLPLVRNPAEIAAYLNSLSVLDFGVVVAKRLENENAGEFLCRILKSHPTLTPETVMETLCDNQVLSNTNLIRSLQVCLESQSDECRKETMVEMFRFISEKLDVTTLGSLHVEFINKLINKNQ